MLRSPVVRVDRIRLGYGATKQTAEQARAILYEELGLDAGGRVELIGGLSGESLLIQLTLAPFFASIMVEFGKDAYRRLKRFIGRMHEVGKFTSGEWDIRLQDWDARIAVDFGEEPLPDEAYAALLDIDLETIEDPDNWLGRILVWDGEAWLASPHPGPMPPR
jgi:hypothetical protein